MKKRWLSLALALCMVLSLLPFSVSAEKFGNLYYKISNNEVTITSGSTENGDLDIPAEIEGYPVTGIDCEFSTNLQRISIPSSVKKIGAKAFHYAWNLDVVYYGGTEADWSKIEIGSDNGALTKESLKIYYSRPGKIPNNFSFNLWPDSERSIALIENGVVIDELPQGISYDAENCVITLNNYQAPETGLVFHNLTAPVTLKLIGENSVLYVETAKYNTAPDRWLQVTGDGSLDLAQMKSEHFIMDSGTINVKWSTDVFWRYGFFNESYGDKEDSDLNYFRILGGTVNIDMSEKLADMPDAKFVGMDVQSGNVEIRNAEVHINLGDNPWLGLGVGWTSQEKVNGGTITMENGTLEITSADYQAYFYDLVNEGRPLHYYIGTDGPEQEVSYEEAITEEPWVNSNGDSRFCRKTDGKGYLLITDKTVTLQPKPTPVSPAPVSPAPVSPAPVSPAPVSPAPVSPAPVSPAPTANPFKDVSKDQYYYEPVLWAVNHDPQITAGTSATTFSPASPCTRGQIVTFLWRAKGCPEPTITKNPFTDVKSSDYFYKAVLWAVEKEITAGTSATTFSPNATVTRAQTVTFLFRMEGYPAADGANPHGPSPFADVPLYQYYTYAVMWAVENNITAGTSATTFSPNAPCTRGQIVTFLYRDLAKK